MSKGKKKLPSEANKKAPSDYQTRKLVTAKTEVISTNKKHK